jgi:hypothetical protein
MYLPWQSVGADVVYHVTVLHYSFRGLSTVRKVESSNQLVGCFSFVLQETIVDRLRYCSQVNNHLHHHQRSRNISRISIDTPHALDAQEQVYIILASHITHWPVAAENGEPCWESEKHMPC